MFLWLPHANKHILWGIACHRYLFKILQQKKKKVENIIMANCPLHSSAISLMFCLLSNGPGASEWHSMAHYAE